MGNDTPYRWRTLTQSEREKLLEERVRRGQPWHSPPHFVFSDDGSHAVHLTAACFEHSPVIGRSTERLDRFACELLESTSKAVERVISWCVLPNHYHILATTEHLPKAISALGRLHGRSAFRWNREDNCRGRQVFCRTSDRVIRSERHFWATVNYVHHNPVRHGYVERWEDWPWSSANEYLRRIGEEDAARIWNEYPLLDYGSGWDEPDM